MADQNDSHAIIFRKDALAQGLAHYFTGKPCLRGHVELRATINLTCMACIREKALVRKKKNPEHVKKLCRESWKKRYPIHKEKWNARTMKWAKENPDRTKASRERNYPKNAELLRAKSRKWYSENKDRARARHVEWYSKNSDLAKRLSKNWRQKNKITVRSYGNNRRARIRNNGGSHTGKDICEIFAAQHERCAYCRLKLSDKYHVDHIVPLSSGGGNDRRNLQILCQPCNQRKSHKDPIDHARSLGKLI